MSLVISGPEAGDESYLQQQIDALEARPFSRTVSSPTLLVQLLHDPSWSPAGVRCVDTLDVLTEPDKITTPEPGVTEVTFGAAFTGVIYAS